MRIASVIACSAIAASVLGLAGCGSESKDTNSPTATAGSSGAQVEIGNTINYGSFGTTADIDCADGKSLNVGGSNNTLTVKGSCASVNIGGADNIVDNVIVYGSDQTVFYKGGDPVVWDRGRELGMVNRIDRVPA